MTQAETSRGRGRPKTYDELELARRTRSFEDLARIQAALERNGETARESRSVAAFIGAIKAGDLTGGVSAQTRTRYRQMLAALKPNLLETPPKRQRAGRRVLVSVGAGAGTVMLAPETVCELVRLDRCPPPPIMLRTVMSPAELELAA